MPASIGLGCEGGDDVVGFPALELEVAVAEGLDDRAEVGELLAQQVGHRLALGLVVLRDRSAVDCARVPRDRDALRLVVREQLEEHVREAEQCVRGEAVARRQLLGEREEGAVREVVAVDEEQLGVTGWRVVDLQLGAGQGLGHRSSEAIVLRLCRSWTFSPSRTSTSMPPPPCWPSAIGRTETRSRSFPTSPISELTSRLSGGRKALRAGSHRPTVSRPAT